MEIFLSLNLRHYLHVALAFKNVILKRMHILLQRRKFDLNRSSSLSTVTVSSVLIAYLIFSFFLATWHAGHLLVTVL